MKTIYLILLFSNIFLINCTGHGERDNGIGADSVEIRAELHILQKEDEFYGKLWLKGSNAELLIKNAGIATLIGDKGDYKVGNSRISFMVGNDADGLCKWVHIRPNEMLSEACMFPLVEYSYLPSHAKKRLNEPGSSVVYELPVILVTSNIADFTTQPVS